MHDLIYVYTSRDISAGLLRFLLSRLPEAAATVGRAIQFGDPPIEVVVNRPVNSGCPTAVVMDTRLRDTTDDEQQAAAQLVFELVSRFTDAKVVLTAEDDTIVCTREATTPTAV